MSTYLLQSYYHLKRGGTATQQQIPPPQQSQQPRIHVNPFHKQSFSPTSSITQSNAQASYIQSNAQTNYNIEPVHYRHPRQLGPFQTSNFKPIVESPSLSSSCLVGRPLAASYVQQHQRYLYAGSPICGTSNTAQYRNSSSIVEKYAGTEVVLSSPLPGGRSGTPALAYPVPSYPEGSLVQRRPLTETTAAVNKITTTESSVTAAAAACSPNAGSYTPMQVLCAVCCLRTRVKEPVHLVQQDNKPFLWTGEITTEHEKMKKSVSGGTIRSPNVKRAVESPVTIRGWLYKQGSDGLMLWKKRWFVLSEYCLFYYKGPEEDKILGSILLPSYTITPCDSTDHIYRKFAFKAEHQNMRTYFFAAENKKDMQQWMNTLSLASILQNHNDNVDESLDRVSKEMNGNHHRRDGEESMYSTYQHRRPTEVSPPTEGSLILRHPNGYPNGYMMNDTENSFHSDDVPYLHPAHNYIMNSSGRYSDNDNIDPNIMDYGGNNGSSMNVQMNDSSGLPRSQHHLYANAPPKPKRMGSNRDLIYESHAEAVPLPSYHSAASLVSRQQQYAVSPGRPNREFVTDLTSPARRALSEEFQQNSSTAISHRRTPDPYARTVPQHVQNDVSDKQYREDEYAATIAAVAGKMHARSPQNDLQSPSQIYGKKYPQQRIQSVRPQSVDFLETDIYSDGGGRGNGAGFKQFPQTHVRNAIVRPMSNIESLNENSVDAVGDVDRFKSNLNLKKGRNSPNVLYVSEKDQSRRTPELNALCNKSFDGHITNNIASTSTDNFRKLAQRSLTPTMVVTPSPSISTLDRAMQQNTSPASWNQVDANCTLPRDRNFLRSYSARFLPSSSSATQIDGYIENSGQYDVGKNGSSTLKSQQREESMKRLIEWKQRMLQSPLTRKYIPKSDSTTTFQKQVHLMASSAATTPSSTMISAMETLQSRQQTKHRLSQPSVDLKRLFQGEEFHIPRTQSVMQVSQRSINDLDTRLGSDPVKDRFNKTATLQSLKPSSKLSNRIQDHRRSTSSLNRFYGSYSSDDEDELKGQLAEQTFTRSQSVKIGSSKSGVNKQIKSLQDKVDYVNITSLTNSSHKPEDEDNNPEYVNLLGFHEDDMDKGRMRYRCHSEPNFLYKNNAVADSEDWSALNNENVVDHGYLYRSKTPDNVDISNIEPKYFQDELTQTVNQVDENKLVDDSDRKFIDHLKCPLAVQEDDASSIEEVRMKDRMYHDLIFGSSGNRDWKINSKKSDPLTADYGEDLALEPPEQFRSPIMDSSNGAFVWTPCQQPKSRFRSNDVQNNQEFDKNHSVGADKDESTDSNSQEDSAKNIVQDRIKIFEAQSEILTSRLSEPQTLSKLNTADIYSNFLQDNLSLNQSVKSDNDGHETIPMLPEEYYLPMNGNGFNANAGSSVPNSAAVSDFISFALDDEQNRSSLTNEIDEAIYVQMDNNMSPKSVFAPHERLMNDDVMTLKSSSSKNASSSTASPTEFHGDSLSFDNFGYYQIAEICETNASNTKNSVWEPIYAEPGAQDDKSDAMSSSTIRSNDVVPTLPQRNSNLMMKFILDNEKSNDVIEIHEPVASPMTSSIGGKEINPRFSLSDSFRPASYYLKMASNTSINDNQLTNEANIFPEIIKDNQEKRDPTVTASKVDHLTSLLNFQTISSINSVNVTPQPPLSPLHSNLNYSYYRVYEDDLQRPANELIAKPLSVSLPTTSEPSITSDNSEFQDDENKKYVLQTESRNTKSPMPVPSLNGAETQWSSTVSFGSVADVVVDVDRETPIILRTPVTSTVTTPTLEINLGGSVSGISLNLTKRSPNSAPYYYSDLLKDDDRLPPPLPAVSPPTSTLSGHSRPLTSPLNNMNQQQYLRLQPDDHTRKVSNIELAQNRNLMVGQVNLNSAELVDPLTAVTNQLTDSIVYWEAKKLSGTEHNFYESDTLRKRTWNVDASNSNHSIGIPCEPSGIDMRNVYPHGILSEKLARGTPRLGSTNASAATNLTQRSRSLEGLLFSTPITMALPDITESDSGLVNTPRSDTTHHGRTENLSRAVSVGNWLNQSNHQDGEHNRRSPVSLVGVRFPGDGEDGVTAGSSRVGNWTSHLYNSQPTNLCSSRLQSRDDIGLPVVEPNHSRNYFLDGINSRNDNSFIETSSNSQGPFYENIERDVSVDERLSNQHKSKSCKKLLGESVDTCSFRQNFSANWENVDNDNSLVDEQFQTIQEFSEQNLNSEISSIQDVNESLLDAQKKLQKMKFNLSAGDLLGKSHEELVLLLIQLRRDQAKLEHKLNKCRMELDSRQRLIQMNAFNPNDQVVSHKQMLQQYEEMTKQYELTKPLVSLVDNMVKLGSLYGSSEDGKSRPENSTDYSNSKKMLEFSRMLQEQRLQHDSQFSDWYHLQQLEQKLQEASKLDSVLLEESHAVSDLQQDKDMLEKVIENLRSKLNTCRDNPVELEKLQKQLRTAEKELLKIRNQLSQGAQKLEETAADNARIENEIGMLRERVQSSIMQGLGNDTSSKASYIKVQLEKELSRISNVMEDLAWKRKELSGALEQLKDRNKALLADVRASPTGVAGSVPLPSRKNHRSTYLETDLDTMETKDIIESWKRGDNNSNQSGEPKSEPLALYVNTYASSNASDDVSTVPASAKEDVDSSVDSEQFKSDAYEPQDIVEADDRTKRFYGLIPRDKPAEIKTVRIVKRESERRSKVRDRRKSDLDGDVLLVKIGEENYEQSFGEISEVVEEKVPFSHTMSLPRNFGQSVTSSNSYSNRSSLGLKLESPNTSTLDSVSVASTPGSTTSGKNVSYYYRTPSLSSLNSEPSSSSPYSTTTTSRDHLFSRPTTNTNTTITSYSSSNLPNRGFSSSPTSMTTPTFKSETARKIVAETAASEILSKQNGRNVHESLLVAELRESEVEPEPALDFDHVHSHDQINYKADSGKRRHKRRAYTISSSQPLALETTMQRMVHARSRDDLDIEQCLRSANTPDVVKSTIKKNDMFDESTIDRELGLPQKIVIPERYVEEIAEEPSPAEQLHRLQKAESIRKMLSETTTYGDGPAEVQSSTLKKKFEAERKQREHLLALNQIIAKEVMERSKAVAARAMKNPPKVAKKKSEDELSPDHPLPLVQQRENLLT
ncbi:hypothetical protein CHUAL_003863 [Chamberlinius hualienensis]